MSDFQMPNIPDDDVSPWMPDLKWAFQMILILMWIWIFSYLLFFWFSEFFIAKLSIEDEKKYFWEFFIESKDKKFDFTQISYNVKLPKNIDVYVKESTEINAFASLWGNIIFTTWLLKKLQYEEEFVFVLWHEIEHILSRDPIQAFSKQFPMYITLTFLWIDMSIDYNKIFELTTSYISRKTEIRADNGWIKFLKDLWWNPYCILPFFEDKDNLFTQYLYFNSTHPTNLDRIENIKKQSTRKKNTFKECHIFNIKKI